MRTLRKKKRREPFRGFMAGLTAGLVAAWMMNEFQTVSSKISQQLRSEKESDKKESDRQGGGEDATMKAADRLARGILGRDLSRQEKQQAGPLVHYGFGATMGGVYGLLSEYFPRARAGFGLLFGAALFAVADEMMVPALGLSKNPTEFPLSTHADALASHFVYGVTTEAVRRGIRAAA